MKVNVIARKREHKGKTSQKNVFVTGEQTRVKALYAERADYADVAGTAHFAEKWGDIKKEDYINQPVKTDSKVHFDTITANNLNIEGLMRVKSLEIDKIRALKGSLMITPANGKIERAFINDTGNYYVLDFGQSPSPFQAGDSLFCNVYSGDKQKFYRVRISNVDAAGQVWIDKTYFEGMSFPEVGDECVVFGSYMKGRQYAIILNSIGGVPAISIYDNIGGGNGIIDNLVQYLVARLGDLNGISFKGNSLKGYGLYSDSAYLVGDIEAKSIKTEFKRLEESDAIKKRGDYYLQNDLRVEVCGNNIVLPVSSEYIGAEVLIHDIDYSKATTAPYTYIWLANDEEIYGTKRPTNFNNFNLSFPNTANTIRCCGGVIRLVATPAYKVTFEKGKWKKTQKEGCNWVIITDRMQVVEYLSMLHRTY